MDITKEIWKELLDVLEKHKIPHVSHFEKRDIQRAMEYPDITVHDKHIQINVVIPDFLEEEPR
jgi:hypothetical protein